ncbi:MAG: signal peptidase II [Bradyrhizobiaceae bacterium]|nr:signal peptidase II [Bradyrhizobiaceae bacterium]
MLTRPAVRNLGIGLSIAALVFVADQATKFIVLHELSLGIGERLAVTPFLDLVITHNRGISYGLFPQDGELGRWFLVGLNLAAVALFTIWMARTGSWLVVAALGFLIGGALGNALDRATFGAVVDFISLHAFGWRWYVFNLADAAIVAGVLALLYDTFLVKVTKTPPSGPT